MTSNRLTALLPLVQDIVSRAIHAARIYRGRGAARMNARLWLHWVLFGKYPS